MSQMLFRQDGNSLLKGSRTMGSIIVKVNERRHDLPCPFQAFPLIQYNDKAPRHK